MLPDRMQHVDTTGGPDNISDLSWLQDLELTYDEFIPPTTPTSRNMVPSSPPMPEPASLDEPQYMDHPMPTGADAPKNMPLSPGAPKNISRAKRGPYKIKNKTTVESVQTQKLSTIDMKTTLLFTVEFTGVGAGDFNPTNKTTEEVNQMLMLITKQKHKIELCAQEKQLEIDHVTAVFVAKTRQLLEIENTDNALETCKCRILDAVIRQKKEEEDKNHGA
jgi:hypothetical protein